MTKRAKFPHHLRQVHLAAAVLLLPLYPSLGENGFLTRTPTGSYRIRNVVEVSNPGKTLTKLVTLLPCPQTNQYQDITYGETQEGDMVEIPGTREKHFRHTVTGGDLPAPGQIKEIGYTYDVTIYSVRANLEQITTIYPYDTGSEIYQMYTGQSGEYADPYNSDIQSIGASIWSQSSDVLDYAERCYLYVAENFRYIGGTGLQPIATVIANGGGDCGNLSGLFVSLLRYKSIPARHISGFGPSRNPHVWADFYMENYGWIPVDVTYKNSNPGGNYFGFYDGRHTVASRGVWFLMDRGDGLTFQTAFLQMHWWWWWWGSSAGEISARHTITSATLPVPDPPLLSSPSDGATGLSTRPWLSWNASSGATSYRVQLSADWDFSTIAYDVSGINTTSHQAQYLSGATTHYWRVFASNASGTSAPSSVWSFTTWSGPYAGSRINLPGTLHVEWYDAGGEGITYHDVDPENHGGACRMAEGVDIEQCADPETGGYNIGWTEPGEWLRYAVTVASAGPYLMEARVATAGSGGGLFHVEVGGVDVSGPVTVPPTGGDQSWTTVRDTLYLTAGAQILTLEMDQAPPGGDVGNLNFLRFTGLPQVTVTVGTSPGGLTFSVDGSPYSSPQQCGWLTGSLHTIGTTSPQPGPMGTQYVWTSWSDGGAISHQIHASASGTYTANFRTEHYLTMSAGPGGMVSPSSGWYAAGSPVSITATADSGYTFAGWEGAGSGSYTGSTNPASIQMNGPVSQRAIFDAALPLPAQVVLVTPGDGSEVGPTGVTMVWRRSGPAVERYWCEVSTDSLFSFASVDSMVVDTTHTVAGLSIGARYWWRVRAYNRTGWGPFSEARTFETLSLPDQALLLWPADGALVVRDTVEAMWEGCRPSVTRYWCEIATDSLFTFKSVDSTLADTCHTFRQLTSPTYWWRVKACNAAGWGPFSEVRKFHVSITSVAQSLGMPTEFSLRQNYPNPFNPETRIEFDIPAYSRVSLKVYNALGEEVATLIDGEFSPGRHGCAWNAGKTASGIYFYRLIWKDRVQTKKMVLIR